MRNFLRASAKSIFSPTIGGLGFISTSFLYLFVDNNHASDRSGRAPALTPLLIMRVNATSLVSREDEEEDIMWLHLCTFIESMICLSE
jgi:hypothetical protein